MTKQLKTRLSTTALAGLLLLLALPRAAGVQAAGQEDSLYDRLGGLPAIEAVVDQLLMNVAADARINRFFTEAHTERLRTPLVELICQATGGPCAYSGRSMAEAHRGLNIVEADFLALVEDLVMALDTLMVPEREKGELLAILAPMQGDIVQAPAIPPPAPPTVAPAAPPSPPAQATQVSVEIRGFAYNPASTTIPVGSTVTWTNFDSAPHTATGPGFDTRPLQRGQSGSATFSTPGQFNYRCMIHPNIQGVIIVQ